MAVEHAVKRHPSSVSTLRGPSLRAVPFLRAASGPIELLSEPQRQQLASIATLHLFPARTVVYSAGAPAEAVFIIGHGAVKSFRDLPSGRTRIAAFLFAHDLFGLAEAGHYVNTVQAMTASTVYRIELCALADAFQRDSELELRFLCKAIHELREAQHHTIVVGQRHAVGRVAMLLRMLERQTAHCPGEKGVLIPMTRSDIANYLGLSLEAVVRASRRLERHGIVHFIDRHHARILDRARFESLARPV
jgi:CRP/FNR family transcriptional regulator